MVDGGTCADEKIIQLLQNLMQELQSGRAIYVHCYGGHGRTGIVACALLCLMLGVTSHEAVRVEKTMKAPQLLESSMVALREDLEHLNGQFQGLQQEAEAALHSMALQLGSVVTWVQEKLEVPQHFMKENLGAWHAVKGCCTARLPSRAFTTGHSKIQNIDDQKFKDLQEPCLVHCGTTWSQRSRRVADALANWDSGQMPIYSLDLDRAPATISSRHIKGIPTLLLMRENRVEARADGADLEDLLRLMEAAKPYLKGARQDDEDGGLVSPMNALKSAEQMLTESNFSAAQQLFSRALEGNPDGAFRARYGLVRCAYWQLVAAVRKPNQGQEGANIATGGCRVAWAFILRQEEKILHLWATGEKKDAIEQALGWYQSVASKDLPGLINAYCLPERRILDRPGGIPTRIRQQGTSHESIYAQVPHLAIGPESPGPVAPRALLRRLLLAAIDENFIQGKKSLVADSLADLAFLLDKEEFIPFYTRRIFLRRGGRPTYGLGTGKRSGFSKRYWICWPETFYPNTKKMGSPHCDKND
eukprot:g22268.t1